MLDLEILELQIEDLLKQMVANGVLNTSYPISTRTDQWAEFFAGSPEQCRENWDRPFFFFYDFEFTTLFQGVDTIRWRCNFVGGVQAKCEAIQGNERKLKALWYAIRLFWSRFATLNDLAGTYTLTDSQGTDQSVTTPHITGTFGMRDLQVVSSLPLITDGKIMRYTGQFQFDLLQKKKKIARGLPTEILPDPVGDAFPYTFPVILS